MPAAALIVALRDLEARVGQQGGASVAVVSRWRWRSASSRRGHRIADAVGGTLHHVVDANRASRSGRGAVPRRAAGDRDVPWRRAWRRRRRIAVRERQVERAGGPEAMRSGRSPLRLGSSICARPTHSGARSIPVTRQPRRWRYSASRRRGRCRCRGRGTGRGRSRPRHARSPCARRRGTRRRAQGHRP